MDKEERHAFLRWLETASRAEIEMKLVKFAVLMDQLTEDCETKFPTGRGLHR